MTLAEKILALRTEQGLSQGDLAEKLEVSRQSVSKWETGQATPDLDKIIKLADLFGVTTDYLLTGKPTLPSDRQVVDRVLRASIESAQIMLGSRSRQPFTAQELSALYESLLTNP